MKEVIENRNGKKICVVTETKDNSKGLVFIMHGLGGNKERPAIQTFKQSFEEEGFDTVVFDARNSSGESEGNPEEVTLTSYYEDLEDVINWAKKQNFYKEPFWLIGHSLGGLAVTAYANNNPQEIKYLIPVSATINVEIVENYYKANIEDINGEKWCISSSGKKFKWLPFIKDLGKYDLEVFLSKLKMPILMVVAENEMYCGPKKEISKKLGLNLEVIPEAFHKYNNEESLNKLKGVIKSWIGRHL